MPIEDVLALQPGRRAAPRRAAPTAASRSTPTRCPSTARKPGRSGTPPRRAGHRAREEARHEHRRRADQARPSPRPRRSPACSRCSRPARSQLGERRRRPRRTPTRWRASRCPPWRRRSPTSTASPAATCFVITLDGARKLAAAMMGMEQPERARRDRAVRARALRRRRGDEPDDGRAPPARPRAVLGTEVEIGAAGDATFTLAAEAADAYPQHARTPSASASPSAASRAGSSSSSRTRSWCA